MVNTSTKPYKWRKFQEHINAQADCSKECRFYQYCPLTTPGTEQRCRLKVAPPKDQRRFFNLYLMGEKGLRDEFFEAVFHLGASIDFDVDTKNGMGYIEVLQKVKRMYYDNKKKEEPKEEKLSFKIVSSHGVIEEVPLLSTDIAEANDPESLYNSDLVQELFAEETEDCLNAPD